MVGSEEFEIAAKKQKKAHNDCFAISVPFCGKMYQRFYYAES